MNVHQCRVALRPRSALEVFDLTLSLLRAHPDAFARMWALTTLPAVAVAGGLTVGLDQGFVILLIAPFFHSLLQGPFTLLAGRLLFADGVRVREVVRELLRYPGRSLAAWFYTAGALLLGVGCSVVGALLTVPAVIYAGEAALLEGGGRTMSRAMRLASSNPANAAAAMGAWGGLTVWGMLVGEGLGQALVGFVLQLGTPLGSLVEGDVTLFMVAGSLVVQPLVALYKLLLYVDARTRVEGWDLQVGLRAARLGAS